MFTAGHRLDRAEAPEARTDCLYGCASSRLLTVDSETTAVASRRAPSGTPTGTTFGSVAGSCFSAVARGRWASDALEQGESRGDDPQRGGEADSDERVVRHARRHQVVAHLRFQEQG